MIPTISKQQIEQTKEIFRQLAETKQEVKTALAAIELTLATIEDKDVMTCGLVTIALFRSLPLTVMKTCMDSFEGLMKTRALDDLIANLKDPETLNMIEEILKNRLKNDNNEEK